MLEAERVHSEALGKEMSQLAEHARACEKQTQQITLEKFEVVREKDGLAAKGEAMDGLTKQLATAHEGLEAARAKLGRLDKKPDSATVTQRALESARADLELEVEQRLASVAKGKEATANRRKQCADHIAELGSCARGAALAGAAGVARARRWRARGRGGGAAAPRPPRPPRPPAPDHRRDSTCGACQRVTSRPRAFQPAVPRA